MKLFEVPPGESLCPYHYEYVEEWLLVLDGDLAVRTPDGEEPAERGGVSAFPAGPAGAHKLTNAAKAPAKLMMFSSAGSRPWPSTPTATRSGYGCPGAPRTT